MRIRLDSIGCRLNISEMESLARAFTATGHRVVGPGEDAEVYIFNTCTVTANASRKSRHVLRQMRRANPSAKIVATGCYAEMSPNEIDHLGVDLVLGNADKDRLPEILADNGILHDGERSVSDDPTPTLGPDAERTRAFIKVQDGCDNRCTFCIVTLARGAGRSRSPESVVEEVIDLVKIGYREVVLSGVHLGSYGHDRGRPQGLEVLVKKILAETDVPRVRLSSLEPWDLEPSFFDLFSDSRLLPHLHLPLQSGCDRTLDRMARRTNQGDFSRLMDAARSRIPDVSISTDIIVGFPGETEAEFEESIAFVRAMTFSRLHVFRYSQREGTLAATMPAQVQGPLASERSRQFHQLGASLEKNFNSSFEGRTLQVLWESSEDFGDGLRWSGLTPNYIRVVTQTGPTADLFNRITSTKIIATMPVGVLGSIDGFSLPDLVQPTSNRLPVISPNLKP
ncbi:MAG: tRNA (N(6)-L-threonylcarbamoyladenosine(37)-C(2))-methylthiotransferase MtaB [Thermoanaerobaculales bacterium]|nr:tRNA (N(6)-L-threonylcarbamoyladenosine(37)-C(2))-methylthiotransferase MtaB [Thermoanaerobaculales bacterium]